MSSTQLTEELKKNFGFSSFKGLQEEVIQNVLAKKNSFVIMPTGGGKSLCYQLPALMLEGTAIVVSPLIALMKNQVDAIRWISQDEGIAHVLNSSLTKTATEKVKKDIRDGITKLLFVAPESLSKEETLHFLKESKISFFPPILCSTVFPEILIESMQSKPIMEYCAHFSPPSTDSSKNVFF